MHRLPLEAPWADMGRAKVVRPLGKRRAPPARYASGRRRAPDRSGMRSSTGSGRRAWRCARDGRCRRGTASEGRRRRKVPSACISSITTKPKMVSLVAMTLVARSSASIGKRACRIDRIHERLIAARIEPTNARPESGQRSPIETISIPLKQPLVPNQGQIKLSSELRSA